MIRHIQILAPIFVLISIVLMGWYFSRPKPEVRPDLPETVVEFRHLSGIQFDQATGKPTFPRKLQDLDGEPVVIAGYMTDSPASDEPGNYQSFRLVKTAPGILFRPPAANEAIFVERRVPEKQGEPIDYPLIKGAIAVRGILRLAGSGHQNRGLEKGYWFAIEDAEIDPMGPP
jgi:hypothetical protein